MGLIVLKYGKNRRFGVEIMSRKRKKTIARRNEELEKGSLSEVSKFMLILGLQAML